MRLGGSKFAEIRPYLSVNEIAWLAGKPVDLLRNRQTQLTNWRFDVADCCWCWIHHLEWWRRAADLFKGSTTYFCTRCSCYSTSPLSPCSGTFRVSVTLTFDPLTAIVLSIWGFLVNKHIQYSICLQRLQYCCHSPCTGYGPKCRKWVSIFCTICTIS